MPKIDFEYFETEVPFSIQPAQEYLEQDKKSYWFAYLDRLIYEDSGEIIFTYQFESILEAAKKIQKQAEYMVCIGIGGSYAGHKAVTEALQPESPTKLLFLGNSLSNIELDRALKRLGDSDFVINFISKSGTTIEPSIAFHILKQKLIHKYGLAEAADRIYATTDPKLGVLREEAIRNHYHILEIPKEVGGRFSVFTAGSLLPMAVAGVDISALIKGAYLEKRSDQSAALMYATVRYQLMKLGFSTEALSVFEPSMRYLAEWWRQLFGETEGKHNRAILPMNLIYSTDLHSMGQYMQEGRRNIFETFLSFKNNNAEDFVIQADEENPYGLHSISNKKLSEINRIAEVATMRAHAGDESGCFGSCQNEIVKIDGHARKFIPVLKVTVDNIDEENIGRLMTFFMSAAIVSGRLQSVNPYDQPGVEAYKAEMKKLLKQGGKK